MAEDRYVIADDDQPVGNLFRARALRVGNAICDRHRSGIDCRRGVSGGIRVASYG